MRTEYGYKGPYAQTITWCRRDIAENIVTNNEGYVMYARDISDARVVSVR
jgi:hypothetical protein